MWIEQQVSTCVNEATHEIASSVKQLLLSNQDNDSIQFPLFELLGDDSFEVIEKFLEHRDRMIAEILSPKPKHPVKEEGLKKESNPLARSNRFIHNETINASYYIVEPTAIARPQIKHIPILTLPSWCHKSFPGCDFLNDIQSTVYETAFTTNENMLISAPTGAGKTNVALLTILHEIEQNLLTIPNVPPFLNRDSDFLIVYITPMKALAGEITKKFRDSLKHLQCNVREYTGDTRISQMELDRTQILVATPEKWDVATRKSGEDALCNRLKLLIIDEIHLLQDDRGPVLEAIVARTLRQVEQSQTMIRIVGLSATLPNTHDVGNFLKVNPCGLFVFGPEYRPVPLGMELIGAKNTNKIPKDFDLEWDEFYSPGKEKDRIQIDLIALNKLKGIVMEGQQAIVFVHSRGETARFANLITQNMKLPMTTELAHMLAKRRLNPQLKECLAKGVGIHHAGLPRADRNYVEDAFRTNAFQILVCTATLAWGVNLPAHTVLIKDTQVYNHEHGGFEDIGILDVHQMFGRAGRPQFDSSGYAILISTSKVLSKYTSTLVNAEPIESKFSAKIEDFLNAEISLGTVTNKSDAIRWIRYTFMYQRLPNMDIHVERIDCAANELNKNMMIRTAIATESLQPTHLGQIASIHYIPFTAVRHFNENLHGGMDESELLDCIFSSGIFQSLIVRPAEIEELSNFEPVITLMTPPDELPGKVNVLFQSYITRHTFRNPSLQLDQNWIADNMQRVFDAIFELAIERGWCIIASFALDLCKMIEHQMSWCGKKYEHPLRQVLKGPKYLPLLYKLESMGLDIDRLKDMEYTELKAMLRANEMASDAVNAAKRFPSVNIGVRYQPMSDSIVQIIVEIVFPFDWDKSVVHQSEQFWLFIQDTDAKSMYSAQEIAVDRRTAKEGMKVEILVPVSPTRSYTVTFNSVHFLSVSDVQQINVTDADRITYAKYESKPPRLRPLHVSTMNDPKYANFYDFEYFNLIQSQLFFQAYHTDESVLICAPTAAGKTVIAELAIIRMLQKSKTYKAVYMVPLKAIVLERVADWKDKFGDMIIELTGDFTPDSDAIARARIIICTPEKWDAVSRGFVVRQFVQFVSVLVIDEVHLLGTDRGHIIEAVVDRMRAMPTPLRIIALSTCLSNPLDVAKFLGVPGRGVYNYPPAARSVPLTTFIRGFPGRHYCPRMAAMNKPVSDAIIEHSKGRPTLVFVSSRKQTRLTALDLIAFANANGTPFIYSTPAASEAVNYVSDPELAHCLSFGVGLHHAGLLPQDCQIIENLFATGKLMLLVATSTLAWGVNMPAHFVVIKGTEYHDAKTCQWLPYSVTEMQQMMGRAGRPQFDKEGIVMILCEESRKDFLKKFINSPFPVESSMPPHIFDHINAEISSGRIRSMNTMKDWIKRTYFALRLAANPKYYDDITIDEIADQAINELTKSHCCEVNIDGDIKPTQAGKICSIYYVSHNTVRLFLDKCWDTKGIVNVLKLCCDCQEFHEVPVRHNEDLRVDAMTPRFKGEDEPCDSPHVKTYYLIQYYLSHRKQPTPDFETDCSSVLDNMLRVVGCYAMLCASSRCLHGMITALHLGQMLCQGVWHDQTPMLSLMGTQSLKKLKSLNVNTIPELLLMKNMPKEFEEIKKHILLYRVIHKDLNEDRTELRITFKLNSGEPGSKVLSPHFMRKEIQSMYIIVSIPQNQTIVTHKRIQLKKEVVTVVLRNEEPISDDAWIYIFSDAYMGIDQMYSVSETAVRTRVSIKQKKKKDIPKEEIIDPDKFQAKAQVIKAADGKHDEEEEVELFWSKKKPESNKKKNNNKQSPDSPKRNQQNDPRRFVYKPNEDQEQAANTNANTNERGRGRGRGNNRGNRGGSSYRGNDQRPQNNTQENAEEEPTNNGGNTNRGRGNGRGGYQRGRGGHNNSDNANQNEEPVINRGRGRSHPNQSERDESTNQAGNDKNRGRGRDRGGRGRGNNRGRGGPAVNPNAPKGQLDIRKNNQ